MESLSDRSRTLITMALEEDFGAEGDISARASLEPGRRGRARIEARQPGIVCGLALVEAVFRQVAAGRELQIRLTPVQGFSAFSQCRQCIEFGNGLRRCLEQ